MGMIALRTDADPRLDASHIRDDPGTFHQARFTENKFSFTLPRFPSSNFSNIDIIFDKAGRNVYALIQDSLSILPQSSEDSKVNGAHHTSRTNELLLFPQKISIFLEAPLIAAIQDVQAIAVRVLLNDFQILDHLRFCCLAFFLSDNRVYEQLSAKYLSFDGISGKSEEARNLYDNSISHTLTYLLTQYLPRNSSSSVSVDFKEFLKAEINPYKQSGKGRELDDNPRQGDDVLSTVLGMRVNVMHTWPVSEVISVTHLEEYNSILQTLLSITCVKWTAETVWKRATDAERQLKISRVSSVSKQSVKISLVWSSYRKCLVGLHWFQYILAGLLGYYMRRIHEGIVPPFLADFEKCASVDELVKSHGRMLNEVSAVMRVEQAKIAGMVTMGHRATSALSKALEMLDSPIVDLSECAFGIPQESSKPLIEIFFDRAEAAYRNLRMSIKTIFSSLEAEAASSRIGRSFSVVGISDLRAVFGATRNWA